jgi:hypothetical protein
MNLSRLIPVCLISSLMGLILPRVFENPAHLTLAAVGYLVVCLGIDRLFGSSGSTKKPANPA